MVSTSTNRSRVEVLSKPIGPINASFKKLEKTMKNLIALRLLIADNDPNILISGLPDIDPEGTVEPLDTGHSVG